MHQLNLILEKLGTPPDETLARIGSGKARDYIKSLPVRKKVSFKELFPKASAPGILVLSYRASF